MVKSEITNDQSEARDKALNSPLFRLVHQTWRYFDEEITQPIRLNEEDIVRYVVWSIETIKGGEAKPSMSCQDLRRSIVILFRDIKYPSEVSEPLSNIICAYVIVCLDCAFMYSYRQDIKSLCFAAENSLHEKFKQKVSECKDIIKNGILQSGASSELGEWCTKHLLNDVFYTEEDAKWISSSKDSKPKLHTNQKKQEEDRTPYVLKYICSDETTRSNRLQRAMILMQNWNWIESPRDADDFFDFFAGEPRACNLKWKIGKDGSNSTVLSFLIQILREQKYFEKQRKATVSSIVKNQFGLTANYNFDERLTSEDKNRIALILVVLDPDTTFKTIPSRGNGDGANYKDNVLYSIYEKELHIVKDLNKWYD